MGWHLLLSRQRAARDLDKHLLSRLFVVPLLKVFSTATTGSTRGRNLRENNVVNVMRDQVKRHPSFQAFVRYIKLDSEVTFTAISPTS